MIDTHFSNFLRVPTFFLRNGPEYNELHVLISNLVWRSGHEQIQTSRRSGKVQRATRPELRRVEEKDTELNVHITHL